MGRFAGKFSSLVLTLVAAGELYAQKAPTPSSFVSMGVVTGSVLNEDGAPQLGARIELFDHLGRAVRKITSSENGTFVLADLPADLYSIKVAFADYLPVRRDGIEVGPGLQSMLQIHLMNLLSSVKLTYSLPSGGMSKDWKWVLRSSTATRPITRFRSEDAARQEGGSKIFSGTRAIVSLAGGDANVADSDLAQSDIGTGFAVSTNILEKNQVQFGGTMAQNFGASPSAMGLCAIYKRTSGGFSVLAPPEITVAMSQIGISNGAVYAAPPGLQSASLPTVRTMSLSIYQSMDLGGVVYVEYGATGESVDYIEHTTRVSPFARVSADLGPLGKVIGSYSDGARPDELRAHQAFVSGSIGADGLSSDDLSSAVNSLSRLPQLSYRDGRLEMQRTESYELGYQETQGSRVYAVSAFTEQVQNGRVNVAGDTSALNSGDLMSDGVSTTSVYNIGQFTRTGVVASVNQRLRKTIDISVDYGRMGGLTASGSAATSGDGTFSSFLTQRSHNVANASINLKAPKASTKISANYGWMDGNAIIPSHVFTTQNTYISPGLNFSVRQPLPSLFGMPGHLELSADLRNLLAQGYVPVEAASGRSLLFVQSPRAIRGGLNFVF